MVDKDEGLEEEDFEHPLPKNPVEIIEQSKSGTIRIPKRYRSLFKEEKPKFAFWREGNRFIFHYVTDEDIPKLNIKDGGKVKGQKKGKGGEKQEDLDSVLDMQAGRRKKKIKVQPELTKYFPYPFEQSNKVAQIWETIFYKLAEDEPNIGEAIERIKYVVLKFTTGDSTNDSRLLNSVTNLILDTVIKINHPKLEEIIQYAKEKIIPPIKSKYLLATSLINLFSAAVALKKDEMALDLLEDILEQIREDNEIFAVIQDFKNLVKAITGYDFPYEVPEIIKKRIYDEMVHYINGDEIEIGAVEAAEGTSQEDSGKGDGGAEMRRIKYIKIDTDGILRFLDFMQDLHLIEQANALIGELILKIPEDDPLLPELREKKKELENINI